MTRRRYAGTLIVLCCLCTRAVGADPGPGRISYANMPTGWQWPPTEAMALGGELCMQDLVRADLQFERKRKAPGKIATPIIVPSMNFSGLAVRQVYGGHAPVMDCHMALALLRHAPLFKTLGIRELVVAGFYQNRRARLRGRSLPILSRHALGLAVDVRAFVTEDGRTLSVRDDYPTEPLLPQLESTLLASGQFRAVVTPGNDRFHRSHFHISATMGIDGQPPEPAVDIDQLLAQLH